MKKIIKNNLLFIIIFTIVVIYVLCGCGNAVQDQRKAQKRIDNFVETCQDNENISEDMYKQCQMVIKDKDIKMDSYTLLTDIVWFRIYHFNPGAFLIIVVPTLFVVCRFLKNKYVINACTRESYEKFLKKFFKQAYKYCWFLPFLALLILLICFTNFTPNPSFSIINKSAIWTSDIINHPIAFSAFYILNMFMYSCIFINIALLIARKHHKFLIAVILSILSYVGIQLFFEVVVNILICQIVFHTDIGYLFNIMNVFTFSDTFGIHNLLLFTSIVLIITSVAVYLCYSNNEKLIVDCEKNN